MGDTSTLRRLYRPLVVGPVAVLVRRAHQPARPRGRGRAAMTGTTHLRRTGTTMRTIGVAALGLAGGVLLGLIVQDVLARLLLDDGVFPDSLPLALLVGALTPALAVAGTAVALVLDGRRVRRDSPDGRA